MDLWSSIRVLVKRWYLTIPLLALSVVVTVAVVGTKPAHYKSEASLVLLDHSTGANNPFAQLGSTQTAFAEVLVASMNSSLSKRDLTNAGVVGAWNVALEGGDAPLVKIETTAPTANESEQSARTIVSTAKKRLAALQRAQGVPAEQSLTVTTVDAPDSAVAEYGSTVKAAIALFGVLFVMSCAAVVAVEALERKRSEGRAG